MREFHGPSESGWQIALDVLGIFLLLCVFCLLDPPLDVLLNSVAVIKLVGLIDDLVNKWGTDLL